MIVNWDKAPKGATHYVVGSIGPWEKRKGDKWFYWSPDECKWLGLNADGDERINRSPLDIIERSGVVHAGRIYYPDSYID